MAKRSAPEVNAGSMADIAFLLLIFFLVTTTMEKDSGITRKLPPMEESEEDVIIKQKNIFTVLINNILTYTLLKYTACLIKISVHHSNLHHFTEPSSELVWTQV